MSDCKFLIFVLRKSNFFVLPFFPIGRVSYHACSNWASWSLMNKLFMLKSVPLQHSRNCFCLLRLLRTINYPKIVKNQNVYLIGNPNKEKRFLQVQSHCLHVIKQFFIHCHSLSISVSKILATIHDIWPFTQQFHAFMSFYRSYYHKNFQNSIIKLQTYLEAPRSIPRKKPF